MKIAFATPQSAHGSTLIGRVLPIANELAHQHEVAVLHLGDGPLSADNNRITFIQVGHEPFVRTTVGKTRQTGLRLVSTMLATALRTARVLIQLRPDVVVIVKPLPHNVAGVLLAQALRAHRYVVLDVDDFELTANALTSLAQRAAVHWSERAGARYAHAIIAATPFLSDHFEQLKPRRAHVHLIPTGANVAAVNPAPSLAGSSATLLYLGSLSLGSGHRVDLLPEILMHLRKTHPAARLIIAGTGDDEGMLREKCEKFGVTQAVEWVGRFTPADVTGLIARSHVIVDPIDVSITARAKSSFRVIAAAQAGWPVVTSNIGIRPHLLPEDLHQRMFAQPASATDYAAKCARLIATPLSASERALLQTHGNRFRWPALAEQYVQCLTYAQ